MVPTRVPLAYRGFTVAFHAWPRASSMVVIGAKAVYAFFIYDVLIYIYIYSFMVGLNGRTASPSSTQQVSRLAPLCFSLMVLWIVPCSQFHPRPLVISKTCSTCTTKLGM